LTTISTAPDMVGTLDIVGVSSTPVENMRPFSTAQTATQLPLDARFSLTSDICEPGVGWGGCEQISRLVNNSGSSPDYCRAANCQDSHRDDHPGVSDSR
jgi:hypothetical protein